MTNAELMYCEKMPNRLEHINTSLEFISDNIKDLTLQVAVLAKTLETLVEELNKKK